jgi:4-amino-4-deoxy-L-arabinose transferase-like glycosyltransferase
MGSLTVFTPKAGRFFTHILRSGLQRRAVRLAAWIDAGPVRAFFLLTMVYVVVVFGLSSIKLLWLDELITLHIAQLGSASAIWQALRQGADPNPPLTHLLVHLCLRLFGAHEFAVRLPAMVGYWIGMLSLYLFLRRRVSPTWALSGTMLSMTMAGFEYSYESRSYGIFYGLSMVAVLCWSLAVDPSNPSNPSNPSSTAIRRRLSLPGICLALAAAISTNYFAVLAFLPVAAGEVARSHFKANEVGRQEFKVNRQGLDFLRAVDPSIWIALFVAAVPLLAFRPMIAHSIAQFAPYAWNKVSFDQVADSYTEMVEIVLYPILAILAFSTVVLLVSRFCFVCRTDVRPLWFGELVNEVRSNRPVIPMHEAVAVFFLMAYPFLGYVVASVHGGMLSPRFVIPVCFGFAIAGVLACYRLFRHSPGAGAIVLCFCAAWFIARESTVGYLYMEQKQSFFKVLRALPEAEHAVRPGAPIVIADPLMALTFQHYTTPALSARIVFPVDFPAIRLYRRDDSPEENLWAGRNSLYTLPIVPLAVFQRSVGQYLILASNSNWLIEDLLHHRYPVQRLAINTRAGAIGGFTPLSHGSPIFYTSAGDEYLRSHAMAAPLPFQTPKNLPNAKLTPSEGGPFDEARN